MSQQLICIVAGQRSGSTALREFLAATGRVWNCGEIFQTTDLDLSSNFFSYCRRNNVLVSDLATGARRIAEAYVKNLRELSADRHTLIDVKFNSWLELSPAWRYPHEEPFFLTFLKRAGCQFVFLQRLDLAQQIVSQTIARAANKWHNLTETDLAGVRLDIDLKQVRRQANLICQSEVFFWNSLKKYGKSHFFVYESMFDGNSLSAATQKTLSAILGEPLNFPRVTKFQRNPAESFEAVPGFSEIVAAVSQVAARYHRPQAKISAQN